MKLSKLNLSLKHALIAYGALATMGVGNAYAQSQDNKSIENEDMEVIAITGQKLSNARAINAKRDATQVVDAIASDDIGSLPDFNIGEAVQRLPGITIQNDQAEARFISIRALNPSYNYMTIDGMSMAVPDRNGRRPYMDTLPSSMVGRIEVFKTLTPDMEGTGIGGQVNLVTRSAYDFDDTFFKVRGNMGGYAENDGFESDNGKSGDADFVFADQFGTDNEFGLVLTGNYYKRDSYVEKTEYGNSRKYVDDSGNFQDPYEGHEVGEHNNLDYHNDRQRHGLSGKFEYKPNDTATYYLSSFWNTARDDEARQTDKLGWVGNVDPYLNEDGSSNSGHATARRKVYLGQFDFERAVWGATLGADFAFDDGTSLEVAYNNSNSQFRNLEYWHEFQSDANVGFTYDNESDGSNDITWDEEASDLSIYKASKQNGRNQRALDEEINEFKADYGFNTDSYAEGWGFKIGGKIRNTDREFDENISQYYPGENNDYTLQTLADQGYVSYSNNGTLELDTRGVFDAFEKDLEENPDNWEYSVKPDEQVRNDYSLQEDIYATYAMGTYAGENYKVVFGARYEKTDWEGKGYSKNNGEWEEVENEGDYDDFLPSANFTYEFSDDVKVHLAYSHAIGRVSYDEMAPVGESISEGDELVINRSNPFLKPRRSKNSDVSFEWYLDEGQGILSVGVFHKLLQDEIMSTTQDVEIEYLGETREAVIKQSVNVDDDINIKGLEVNFVKNLSMLPEPLNDLGFSANATWIDTDFEIADDETASKSGYFNEQNLLVGQSDEVYNAAFFYENELFSSRIAYNYTGMKLTSVNFNDPWKSRYDKPMGKFDFQASYHFNEQIDFSMNVWNLTNEKSEGVFGRDQEIKRFESEYGRAVFFGISYKM